MINHIVVATSTSPEDNEIEMLCNRINITVFRGPLDDVLTRYYQAASRYKFSNIVRITADCPLIDSNVIDLVIQKHIESRCDYTTNTIKETFPDGLDVEVFTYTVLELINRDAKWASEREHVTLYIRNNPKLFKLCSVEHKEDLSNKRWTLDETKDYEFLSIIYDKLYNNGLPKMEGILSFLQNNQNIEKINNGIKRNEGLIISLKKDRIVGE